MAGVADEGFPSQIKSGKVPDRPLLAELLRETEDLRMLFVDPLIVKRRVAESLAVLDYGDSRHASEIKITSGTTVGDVINQTFLVGWNGSPQLKLIKKDTLYQSVRLPEKKDQKAVDDFLMLEVAPGDCIIRLPQS